ncbi:uncharacterized protein Tco025E_07135 [Trypanosoma conorhini]|uniref:Uncharacterized protein n=1 Tax=Trypanosoma conorhini TaxID=83891 RepID=A0A3R7KK23_9TRYP|nr:uncharacterized protein Tco025E_07135 [Trypanosoma conorhini]RNF09041.1 hypothetical protein Tco025E_07135 [Trypanosoma conorhini]
MRSARNLRAEAQVTTDRSLPSFDNHYSNGVLMENWQEGRIYDACGRKFTLAMDRPVGVSHSMYTTDYTNPGRTSPQPMMRRRGLGKELMFGEGKPATFDGVPTSTTYGETQRHLIHSKNGKPRRSPRQMDATFGESGWRTFSESSTVASNCPTADEDNFGRFSSTKAVMDLPVECYHFQRQMACHEMSQ